MSVAFFPRTSALGKIIIKESFMNNKYVHTPRKNALGIRKMVCCPSERRRPWIHRMVLVETDENLIREFTN